MGQVTAPQHQTVSSALELVAAKVTTQQAREGCYVLSRCYGALGHGPCRERLPLRATPLAYWLAGTSERGFRDPPGPALGSVHCDQPGTAQWRPCVHRPTAAVMSWVNHGDDYS